MPNRLAAIPKPIRDSSHLWIVADQQTAIAFHVMLDRRHPFCRIFGTRDATTMCDDLMPALYERCRVIGANVVAHQKQNFHLSSLDNRSNDRTAMTLISDSQTQIVILRR